MRQSRVYQSVARATGESLRRIRHMGFVLVVPRDPKTRSQSQQAETYARDESKDVPYDRRPA